MPVIDVYLEDFKELLGREVTIKELQDRLPMMGTSWEGVTEKGFALEVFPNRPDLLSIEGLARAYASWIGEKPGLRNYPVKKSNYTVFIDEKTQLKRPYFVTAVVKKVDFDDPLIRSIIQLQEKLHVTHGRKRRKVAIGLHNLDPVEFPVIYTTKPPEFKFRPLGERFDKNLKWILNEMQKGKEYSWTVEGFDEYPMILDKKGMVLSMPPIINGEYTRVDEATTELFIDVTGTDLKAIREVLNVICTTFADRGAEIYEVHNHYPSGRILTTPDLNPWTMDLENGYVNKTLGVEFTPETSAKQLRKMGHDAEVNGDTIKVKIPCYRADIMHPIDLVEDVAIAYDYDNFKPVIPDLYTEAGEDPIEIFSRQLRNFMVGFGLLEVVTFIMSNYDKLFRKMMLPDEPICETENPKMESYDSLRNKLLPSLMEILSFNKHHPYPQNLFEIDDIVVLDHSSETGARTNRRLSVVLCHSKANFSEIKGLMESILDNLELKSEVVEGGWDCFIEGRRYIAKINGHDLCWAGEVRPDVLEAWELEMPVSALEMDVDYLYSLIQK